MVVAASAAGGSSAGGGPLVAFGSVPPAPPSPVLTRAFSCTDRLRARAMASCARARL